MMTPTEQFLREAYGTILSASQISECLGYTNTESFRLARRKGNIPVRTFKRPGGRAILAYVQDMARYIDDQRGQP